MTTKILFVCHGNICRSPMAEFVMKDLVKKEGLSDQFEIQSAATSTEEIGNSVHPKTKRKLAQNGIDCSGKHARQLIKADYLNYDYLIGMDQANIRNMLRICNGDDHHKIYKLLAFAKKSSDIADPWYTDDFDTTWNEVVEGCKGLLENIRKTKN